MNVPSDSKETAKPTAVKKASQAVKQKILSLPTGSSKPNGKAKKFVKATESPAFSLNAVSSINKKAKKKASKDVKAKPYIKPTGKVEASGFFAQPKRKSTSTVKQPKSPPELLMNKKMKGSEDEA